MFRKKQDVGKKTFITFKSKINYDKVQNFKRDVKKYRKGEAAGVYVMQNTMVVGGKWPLGNNNENVGAGENE